MTTLHNLEKDLSANLFNIALRLIANHLDDFFIDSLVMNTKFSLGGAAQFQFDMTRNLFALFGQYSRRPDLLFKKYLKKLLFNSIYISIIFNRVHDACILLTTPRGNAFLLHQTLKDDISIEDKLKALKEIGVINFKSDTSVDILERRTDIRVY